MLVGGIAGTGTDANAVMPQFSIQASTSSNSVATTTATTTDSVIVKTNKNAEIESKVRLYFADTPIMAEIAKCESRFRQFSPDGNVFRGKINNQDVGVTQINEYYHAKRAKKLGYNIYSLDGNMAYAKLLYEEEGTDPWVSSSPCWKKSDVAKAMSATEKKVLADNVKLSN